MTNEAPTSPPEPLPLYVRNQAGEESITGWVCGHCHCTQLIGGTPQPEQAARNCCWCPKHGVGRGPRARGIPWCHGCEAERKAKQEAEWSAARSQRESEWRKKAVPWDDTMEGLVDDEHYHESPEDYFDYHWDSGLEMSDKDGGPSEDDLCYCWEAVRIEGLGLDAESIVENAWEQAEPPDGMDCDISKESIADLQALLDGWLATLPDKPHWYTSGRYVDLSERRKAWCESVRKEQAEDAK